MRILLPLFILLASACSRGGSYGAEELPADAAILAFGDSITFGLGARRDESYPAQLEKLSARRVINAGEPNELAARALDRLTRTVNSQKVDLLILCHGGNDLLEGRAAAKVKESLSGLIKIVRDKNIPLILLAVPEPKNVASASPIYKELAEEHGIPIDLEALPRLYSDPAFKADKIHLNARGYMELAQAVQIKLKELGFILLDK